MRVDRWRSFELLPENREALKKLAESEVVVAPTVLAMGDEQLELTKCEEVGNGYVLATYRGKSK